MSGTTGTVKSDADLLAQFRDGQVAGSITPQFIRDIIVSETANVAAAMAKPNQAGLSSMYVDSVNGDDSGTGASASPFQTLARASASLQVGSVVNLVVNSVFNETITINQPNVTLQPTGSGAAPRVSGGIVAQPATSSWTQETITPTFVDQETFESGTMSGFWTTQAGAIDTTRAKNGTKSWRYAGSAANSTAAISGNYAEFTGWIYIDSASTAASGNMTRVMGFEGSAFNGVNGCFIWASYNGSTYQLGVGRGGSISSSSSVSTNTWTQFRVAISTNSGNSTDFFALYLSGASTPTVQLTAQTFAATSGMSAEWGVFGYQASVFTVNFDDFTYWNTASVASTTNNWYTTGVSTPPMVVTVGGATLGQRRFAKSALKIAGDYWWDSHTGRLYIYNSANPYTAYNKIEYSQRNWPIQIQASGASISAGITISHHNLDDGTIGVQTNGYAVTNNASGSWNGKDVVNYVSRPGRDDSLWNRRLTGSETYTAAPSGFNSLSTGLSGWAAPHSSSIAVFYAQNADPVVNVLFYNPASTISGNLYSATWMSSGNNTTIETAILAGISDPIVPLTPFGSRSRYYYSTTSRSGTGWNLLPYPNMNPTKDPGTAVLRAIHCPAGAVPSLDNDAHFAVYQPNGLVVETYATIRLSDGRIVMGNWNITDPSGPLDGTCGGMTASLNPNFAGVIRDAEVTAGVIPHAISALVPASYWAQSYVAPAKAFDRSTIYSGTLPYGSRFAIPPSVNLAAHSFGSTIGAMIALAAQNFGVIGMDAGGAGFTWRTEGAVGGANAVLNTYDGPTNTDLTWIVSQLQVVTGIS